MIPLYVDQETLRHIYEQLDGLVISGGGDIDPTRYGQSPSPYVQGIEPNRDEIEAQLVRWAVEDDKPLLAICRGIQVMNVALGGSLIQDIPSDVKGALRHDANTDVLYKLRTHEVMVTPGSLLHTTLGINGERLAVNSLHHQAIGDLAPGLEVVARADDGIIEGVEMRDRRFALGVQWHPETLVDECPSMKRLFTGLAHATGEC